MCYPCSDTRSSWTLILSNSLFFAGYRCEIENDVKWCILMWYPVLVYTYQFHKKLLKLLSIIAFWPTPLTNVEFRLVCIGRSCRVKEDRDCVTNGSYYHHPVQITVQFSVQITRRRYANTISSETQVCIIWPSEGLICSETKCCDETLWDTLSVYGRVKVRKIAKAWMTVQCGQQR